MELLCSIEGVSVRLDDILIKGSMREENDKTLRLVLSKLQSTGLKLKLGKCPIGVPSATYLGYKFNKQGIHRTKDKVKVISEAPVPTNTTQLRAGLYRGGGGVVEGSNDPPKKISEFHIFCDYPFH